jgi:hypothetical protein
VGEDERRAQPFEQRTQSATRPARRRAGTKRASAPTVHEYGLAMHITVSGARPSPGD